MEQNETLYTVAEVAERFKVSPRTVQNWIKDGDMAAYAVGKTNAVLRIGESQIQDYLDRHSPTEQTDGDNVQDEIPTFEKDA